MIVSAHGYASGSGRYQPFGYESGFLQEF